MSLCITMQCTFQITPLFSNSGIELDPLRAATHSQNLKKGGCLEHFLAFWKQVFSARTLLFWISENVFTDYSFSFFPILLDSPDRNSMGFQCTKPKKFQKQKTYSTTTVAVFFCSCWFRPNEIPCDFSARNIFS